MIKIPFKERWNHMICGVLLAYGMLAIGMAFRGCESWLAWCAEIYIKNRCVSGLLGVLFIFIAFIFSYLTREYKDNQ